MHFRNIAISLVCIVTLLIADQAQAQNYRKRHKRGKVSTSYHRRHVSSGGTFRKYQYVGFGVNALNYYGDLAPVNRAASTDISYTRPGFGFLYGYRYHPQAGIRANLNWGRLKGDDITSARNTDNEARYLRNLSFRNDIIEFNVGFDFHLFRDNNSPSGRHFFNAYLFVGGGFFLHNPKGKIPDKDYQSDGNPDMKDAGKWVGLRELKTEGQDEAYSMFEWNVPVGIGAHLKIPETPFDVHVEFGYRFVFTDYLDDVSDTYQNLDLFDSELARVMSDRSAEPVGVWNGDERTDFETVRLQFGDEYYTVNGLDSGESRWGRQFEETRMTMICISSHRSS